MDKEPDPSDRAIRVLALLAQEQLRSAAERLSLVDLAAQVTHDVFAARQVLQRLLLNGWIELEGTGEGRVTEDGLRVARELSNVGG